MHDEIPKQKKRFNDIVINFDRGVYSEQSQYQDTEIFFNVSSKEKIIPEKIIQMRKLYEYGKDSYEKRAKNFYRQGKFMEDYEDDYIYSGRVYSYFSTYDELFVPQLREYFTWRTQLRRGNYLKIVTSSAYIYIYELLNGIGTKSVEESLRKLREFDINYIQKGMDTSKNLGKNVRKWMFEFAVINQISPDMAMMYLDEKIIEQDRAICILYTPENYSDNEIFDALKKICNKQLEKSLVIKKYKEEGMHLFAQIWKYLSSNCKISGKKLFNACFGGKRAYRWYPLESAIYYNRQEVGEITYILNDVRDYSYKDNIWIERAYHKEDFNRKILESVLHESERKLRLYLKTGRYLNFKAENEWISKYIDSVIETDKKTNL